MKKRTNNNILGDQKKNEEVKNQENNESHERNKSLM